MTRNNYWIDDAEREGQMAYTLFAQATGLTLGWRDLESPCKDAWIMACRETLAPKPEAAVLQTAPFTMGDL